LCLHDQIFRDIIITLLKSLLIANFCQLLSVVALVVAIVIEFVQLTHCHPFGLEYARSIINRKIEYLKVFDGHAMGFPLVIY